MWPLWHAAAINIWAVGLKCGYLFRTLTFKVTFIFKDELFLNNKKFEISLNKNRLIDFLKQLQLYDFPIRTF